MKILKKIKFLCLLVNFALICCGVAFIVNLIKRQPISSYNNDIIEERTKIEASVVEDLSICQNELFITKNNLEQAINIPDTRKDIINLLFILKDVEKDLGNKRNFSNECVKIFSLCSRIPIVQEYILKYKKQFFEKNCIIDNNNDILQMILPFQVKILEQQKKQNQNNEKLLKKIFNEVKFQISKLFITSNIQKSDFEIAIENHRYNDALNFLIAGQFEQNDDFNKLYNSVSILKNMNEMIYGIYDILKTNN